MSPYSSQKKKKKDYVVLQVLILRLSLLTGLQEQKEQLLLIVAWKFLRR